MGSTHVFLTSSDVPAAEGVFACLSRQEGLGNMHCAVAWSCPSERRMWFRAVSGGWGMGVTGGGRAAASRSQGRSCRLRVESAFLTLCAA